MGFFSGIPTGEDRKSGGSTSKRLVGDWKTGAYAFGDYLLEVDSIFTKETRNEQPLILIEFTVKEVLVNIDGDGQRIPSTQSEGSVSHKVGESVSVGYITERNHKGNLTEKGTKAMNRALNALEAIIGLPPGTIDGETAEGVLEDPEAFTGGLVRAKVKGRETKNGTLWVQEYFDIAK